MLKRQQQQHFLDEDGTLEDPREQHQNSSDHPFSTNASANNGNVDTVLFKNLVEMVPLVESLMDRRSKSSFTRRASLIYTRTPAREPHPKKVVDAKGRKAQTIPSKKRVGGNGQSKKTDKDYQDRGGSDDFSIFSSRELAAEMDRDELVVQLREQVKDLENKLSEKDEVLKSVENSMNQMSSDLVKLDDLRRQVAEKDSIIKSAHLQLSDAKIKLADKQAALEKLQWEVMSSNNKVEKLQQDLDSIDSGADIIMQVIEALGQSGSTLNDEKKSSNFNYLDRLPYIEEEVADEIEMQKMEEARQSYIAAVAYAKENPSEEMLAVAAEARFRLQSFVLGPNSIYVDTDDHSYKNP